jgi:hypothetical protein
MTTLLTEVYDAFVSAGVPEDKARKAAEALSGHERRFDKLENTIDLRFANLDRSLGARFASMKNEMDTRFAKSDGEFLLLKWMMGFTLALVGAIFAKQFVH